MNMSMYDKIDESKIENQYISRIENKENFNQDNEYIKSIVLKLDQYEFKFENINSILYNMLNKINSNEEIIINT